MLTLLQADPTSMLEKAEESILNFKLIDTSKFALTLWDVVVIAIIILGATLLLQLIKKGIFSAKGIETGKKYSLYNLVKYIVVFITFMWALQSLGVNVSLLMGGSAALLVGIGLGLQNLFSDFVSGIILLADSSIRVGDVIEVDGLVCQVTKIKLRTTQVVTRDDKCILLPNTQLTKKPNHQLVAQQREVAIRCLCWSRLWLRPSTSNCHFKASGTRKSRSGNLSRPICTF